MSSPSFALQREGGREGGVSWTHVAHRGNLAFLPPTDCRQAIQNTRMTLCNQCLENSKVTKSHIGLGFQPPASPPVQTFIYLLFVRFQLQLTWWTKTSRGGSTGLPSLFVIEMNPKPIRTLNHLQKPDPDRI